MATLVFRTKSDLLNTLQNLFTRTNGVVSTSSKGATFETLAQGYDSQYFQNGALNFTGLDHETILDLTRKNIQIEVTGESTSSFWDIVPSYDTILQTVSSVIEGELTIYDIPVLYIIAASVIILTIFLKMKNKGLGGVKKKVKYLKNTTSKRRHAYDYLRLYTKI